MNISLRQALPEELTWVNEQYDKVQFQHSDFCQEFIAVAEVNGVKAGLGRLVKISEQEVELGGMYVNDAFRGAGVARQLVSYLLQQAAGKKIYCLPFKHLEKFYLSFGFTPTSKEEKIPCKIAEKLGWCNETYPQDTLLLALQN